MSVARGFGLNGQALYTNVAKPIEVNLTYTVASTNANGLGLTSLKSNGYVRNVFMHTTQTPGTNDGATNPNPAAGFALIQLKNNFNAYLGSYFAAEAPTTGSPTGTLVNHTAYIIAALGTTTLAQWQAAGLPAGLTPTVGQSFIAISSGALGGSGTVIQPGSTGISYIETVGDPNLSIANSSLAQNGGAYVLVQFLGQTFSSASFTPAGTISRGNIPVTAGTAGDAVTNDAGTLNSTGGEDLTVDLQTFTGSSGAVTGSVAFAPANPADGSIISMRLCFDGSGVSIDGL